MHSIQIIRPVNLLLLLAAQLTLTVFAAPDYRFWWISPLMDVNFWVLCFSVIAVAAGGYVINDYYDVKIDAVNRPNTLVVGPKMERSYALVLHIVFTIAGIAAAWAVGVTFALLNISSAFLLWWYSVYLKKLPLSGNVAVSLLTATALYVPELYLRTGNPEIPAFVLLAFFANLLREMIKDCEDMKGDRAFGCRTLPIVLGISRTKKILYLVQLILIASLLTVLFWLKGIDVLPVVFVLLVVGYNMFLTYGIYHADTSKDFHRLSTHAKLMMLPGILGPILV